MKRIIVQLWTDLKTLSKKQYYKVEQLEFMSIIMS